MITRIVKMTFLPEKCDTFLALFNAKQKEIKSFDGCKQVNLLQDTYQKNIYFTYSIWLSEDHLQKYRQSKLFKDTWKQTKKLFGDKPEAWSLELTA